jgi:hypothetical protein
MMGTYIDDGHIYWWGAHILRSLHFHLTDSTTTRLPPPAPVAQQLPPSGPLEACQVSRRDTTRRPHRPWPAAAPRWAQVQAAAAAAAAAAATAAAAAWRG